MRRELDQPSHRQRERVIRQLLGGGLCGLAVEHADNLNEGQRQRERQSPHFVPEPELQPIVQAAQLGDEGGRAAVGRGQSADETAEGRLRARILGAELGQFFNQSFLVTVKERRLALPAAGCEERVNIGDLVDEAQPLLLRQGID